MLARSAHAFPSYRSYALAGIAALILAVTCWSATAFADEPETADAGEPVAINEPAPEGTTPDGPGTEVVAGPEVSDDAEPLANAVMGGVNEAIANLSDYTLITARECVQAATLAKHKNTETYAISTKTEADEKAERKLDGKYKSTVSYSGVYVPYIQGTSDATTAPNEPVAATWFGNGDTDDGENSYFIGHNPGCFSGVMDLEVGDEVIVWDDNGRAGKYTVYDTMTLPNASNLYQYMSRIYPSGETVTLQTCSGDHETVRCVMAK